MAGFRVLPVVVLLTLACVSGCVEVETAPVAKVAAVPTPPPAPKAAATPAAKKPAAPKPSTKPAAPQPSTKPIVIDFGGEGGGGGGW